MKALVVINEQHTLLPDQERVLLERFESFERVNVPAEGWNIEQILDKAVSLWAQVGEAAIVFASPIPALLAILARWDGQADATARLEGPEEDRDDAPNQNIFVLHNDRRDKKELPGGKVIMTIAAEGWQLV